MTRNDTIEEVAVMLARSYPGNVSTNAFCAAIRSMKTKERSARADYLEFVDACKRAETSEL